MAKANKSTPEPTNEQNTHLLLPPITTGSLVHSDAKKRRRSILLGFSSAIAIFALILAASYGRGSLEQVSIAGVKVSNKMSVVELEQVLSQKSGKYRLNVTQDGQSSQYSMADIGINIDSQKAAENAVKAKTTGPLIQRLAWWKKKTLPIPYNVREDAFQEFIGNKLTHITKAPVNASLAITDGKVTIAPEVAGEGLTYRNANTRLPRLVTDLDDDFVVLQKQPIPAKLTSDQLQPLKQKIETILAKPVQFNLKGRVYTPTAATIGSWIDLPDFTVAKGVDIEVNSGKILEYLDGIARPYVATPRNEVVMVDETGQPQTLIFGRNGTGVANKSAVAADVAKSLAESKGFTIDLTIDTETYKTVSAQNYDKWILVDVAAKQLYAYEKDVLVKKYPVSAGAPATPTVLGEYKIYAKVRVQDMTGLNADGSTYFQPKVEWTNYFYGSYAIHGNYWRPTTWFGNVNSSHGCVGLQDVNAQWIYNWAPVGTPVITH